MEANERAVDAEARPEGISSGGAEYVGIAGAAGVATAEKREGLGFLVTTSETKRGGAEAVEL